MRLISLAFVALCAAVSLTGCKSRPITAPQRAALVGVWENSDGSRLTIYNNGVFTVYTAIAVLEPAQLRGRIERGGDKLLISYEQNTGLCQADNGLYAFEQKEAYLQLEVVEETCSERERQLAGRWTHVARLPNNPIPIR